MSEMHRGTSWSGYVQFTDPSALGKPTSVREEVLDEAKRLIVGDRESQYGDPTENLNRIANYWNDYLHDAVNAEDLLTAQDVAHMMILLKIARQAAGYKRDSEIDIAGYAAIAAEAAERKDNR